MSVSRNKYEKAKDAAKTWFNLLNETQNKLEKLQAENNHLLAETERWKKLSEQLPDLDDTKNLSKTVKALKKQLLETEEKYKNKISMLEREKILSDGKVQQLEEARKDLQERYNDLKQDFREQQKMLNSKHS